MQMSTLLLYVTIAGEIKCGWTMKGEGDWCLVQHTSLTVNDTLCTSTIEPQQHRRYRSSSGSGTVTAAFDRKVICTFYCYRLSTIHIYASACSGSGRFRGSPNMSISIIARHFSESEANELCDLFHALMGSCYHSLSQWSFKKNTCCSW